MAAIGAILLAIGIFGGSDQPESRRRRDFSPSSEVSSQGPPVAFPDSGEGLEEQDAAAESVELDFEPLPEDESGLAGIQLQAAQDDGGTRIVSVNSYGPADRAGLTPGLLVLAVDGERVSDLNLEQVARRITGPAGTSVTLTVASSLFEEERTVTITRIKEADLPRQGWTSPGTDKSGRIGVGFDSKRTGSEPRIASVHPAGPAFRAGLKPGLLVLAVDGERVAGLGIDEVIQRISGPVGTSVTLTVASSPFEEERAVTVTRIKATDLSEQGWTSRGPDRSGRIGIGFDSKRTGSEPRIVSVHPAGPAFRAGLKPGFLVLAVDGQKVAGLGIDEVIQRISGPVGTDVSLTVGSSFLDPGTRVTMTRVAARELSEKGWPTASDIATNADPRPDAPSTSVPEAPRHPASREPGVIRRDRRGAASRETFLPAQRLPGGPQPTYTEEARRAGIEGVVVLEVTIRTDGRVGEIEVLEGLPLGLTESAIRAARQMHYQPARSGGQAVESRIRLSIRFEGAGN